MNVRCPECDKPLKLKPRAGAVNIRCPGCAHVFVVEPEEADEEPKAKPAPKKRKRPSDDDASLPELREKALAMTRFAGWFMLATALFTTVNLGYNFYSYYASRVAAENSLRQLGAEVPRTDWYVVSVAFGCIFTPLVALMLAAARSLLVLGARWQVFGGAIANGILALMMGAGVVLLIYGLLRTDAPVMRLIPTLILNALTFLLNVRAAVAAVRAVLSADVRAYGSRLADN